MGLAFSPIPACLFPPCETPSGDGEGGGVQTHKTPARLCGDPSPFIIGARVILAGSEVQPTCREIKSRGESLVSCKRKVHSTEILTIPGISIHRAAR